MSSGCNEPKKPSSHVNELSDGIDALLSVLSLEEIASLIERTARWVSPDTFNLLPLWYPEHARRSPLYKANWSEPQLNKNRQSGYSVEKLEGNGYASHTLTLALGLRSKVRPNWSCCHIWGIDDPQFQKSNLIVMDRRFYSCVANMVLLPTPLKAFTDTMPNIKAMLRICARNTYGWNCDHNSIATINAALDLWTDWSTYPKNWPRYPGEKLPTGTVPLNDNIRKAVEKRKAQIRKDLEYAGPRYPRDEVLSTLSYWKISL